MRIRGLTGSDLVVKALKAFQCASLPPPNPIQTFRLPSISISTVSAYSRGFSTGKLISSELSSNLIKIMEQKLSAIEHRGAFLQDILKKTAGSLFSGLC
ncbi:hypothetical protein Nepgr_032661 [Nepenthes gracilis]|uniref:Uncharacterized protein n=1 Tax=Nepenthes gracilis TaxID=150966 RepID=A0AAD3TKV4_NEPGR|nr:hypothetical protein Nepgr_032661 [Nepenthes gracilis]